MVLNLTVKTSVARLDELCNMIPPLMHELGDAQLSEKKAPGKWSKKEIIGHLIDSAANNHRRLICGQFEEVPHIGYDQDLWNKHSFHQSTDARQLVNFWEYFNRQLVHIMKNLPDHALEKEVRPETKNAGKSVTLGFIIEDYVAHLEHHLRQLVKY